jgi:hypothetical protein
MRASRLTLRIAPICCLLSRILGKGKVLIEAFAGNRIQVTVELTANTITVEKISSER